MKYGRRFRKLIWINYYKKKFKLSLVLSHVNAFVKSACDIEMKNEN